MQWLFFGCTYHVFSRFSFLFVQIALRQSTSLCVSSQIFNSWDKPISSNEKLNVTDDPQFSLLIEFWETTEASRERSAEQLFDNLECVMLVTEASNLGVSENRFEPTAS